MTGTSIFRKATGPVEYYDQITVGEYSFDAAITVQEKRGDPSAIHCGRIVCFELICDDELVVYFDEGQWYLTPEGPLYDDDKFVESVRMARDLLIRKWSNPEKVKVAPVKTDLF